MITAKQYQPTEYEQMLIAAGWVTVESLDDDYLEYIASVGAYEAASYSTWQSMRNQLAELNAEYETAIEPLYHKDDYRLSYFEQERGKQLLDSMSDLEVMLGY